MRKKDNVLLNKVKATSQRDFWHELPEAVKQSINGAKVQLDRGEGIEHDKVMVDMKSKFLSKQGK
jgi:hypothetical protein